VARPRALSSTPPTTLRPRFLSPPASCQPRGATSLRRDPTHRSRCALRVSHPLDALLPPRPAGLVSSRSRSWGFPTGPCSRRDAVRPLGRRRPRGFSRHSAESRPPLQGLSTPQRARPRVRGLAGWTASVPPWASPLRGVLLRGTALRATGAPPLTPLAKSVERTGPPGPQGTGVAKRSRSLARPTLPPWGFLPR
jgi:hypothetical protein